jgi:phage-related protein
MSGWELVYYATARGRSPVQDYLDGLDATEADAVVQALDLLEEFGVAIGGTWTKHIHGKLWELRCRGQNQHRVFYVAATGRRLVVLHAFTKKTRQTPLQEIKTAEQRLRDYEQRGQP